FAAETLAPGAFMLWLGFAASALFLAVLLLPGIPVLAQVAAFVVLSFVSIQVYRKWFRGRQRTSDQPALNRRTAALVGRVVPLERAIVDGRGRVQIADAFWDVAGPTCRPAPRCGSSAATRWSCRWSRPDGSPFVLSAGIAPKSKGVLRLRCVTFRA